ncbi:hypothetical protein HDU90_007055 [Geranomyces variabilis]|nr:hypothetical protein HDU90_007055 [Geranomyces variabilis]
MVRATTTTTTPAQAFNDSVAAQTAAPKSEAAWWPAVADPSAPSFYGVAALAEEAGPGGGGAIEGAGETVFLADTRFNVVQMANLKTGMRRLLFDPALLEVFAKNATMAAASSGTPPQSPASPSPLPLSSSSSSSSSTASASSSLSGIIRTSREGRGDVLLVGLNNQIWRVPSPQPNNNVTTIGDAVEMLAAGFGAAWAVKDLCQYGNRVVVSVVRTAMPSAATTTTTTSTTTNTAAAAAVESHAPSSAVVVRYNVFPSGLGPSILGTPRIVRRVIMQPGVTASTFTTSPALKLDCDATHVYIADAGVLAMHDLVTGKEIVGAARKIDVDEPTAVVVAPDGGVLVTGKCKGLWCADQLPPPVVPPAAAATTPPAAKQTRTVFVTADLPEPTTPAV